VLTDNLPCLEETPITSGVTAFVLVNMRRMVVGRGGIELADFIWGNNFENGKRKKGKNMKVGKFKEM
jgi:hypothetical protein